MIDKVLKDLKTIDLIKDISKNWQDILAGGSGDKYKPSDFNQEELKKGLIDELEHTNDIHIALEIAMDHLSKNPNYYSEQE